jgi:hypothetical protein
MIGLGGDSPMVSLDLPMKYLPKHGGDASAQRLLPSACTVVNVKSQTGSTGGLLSAWMFDTKIFGQVKRLPIVEPTGTVSRNIAKRRCKIQNTNRETPQSVEGCKQLAWNKLSAFSASGVLHLSEPLLARVLMRCASIRQISTPT